jgi:hypothetical protein
MPTNDYYQVTGTIDPFTKARSAPIEAEFQALQDAFDMIPDISALGGGNKNFVTAGGTANAITVTLSPAWASYTGKDGHRLNIKIVTTNTDAVTVSPNGLTPRACVANDGEPLVAGDLVAGAVHDFIYNESSGKFFVPAAVSGLLTSLEASAASSASAATTQAGIATTQAGIATAAADSVSSGLAGTIHGATGKTTPVDADQLAITDSAASNALKKLTWANLKATIFSSPTITNQTVTNYTETTSASTGNTTVNLANGTIFRVTTNGNNTITLPASVNGKSYVVTVIYGGTHTITWAGGGTIKWAGGAAPTLTSVNGKKDSFLFECDGTETIGYVRGVNI